MQELSADAVKHVSGGFDVIDGIHLVEVGLIVGSGIAGAAVAAVPITVGIAATLFAFAVGTAIGKGINALTSDDDDDDDDDD